VVIIFFVKPTLKQDYNKDRIHQNNHNYGKCLKIYYYLGGIFHGALKPHPL
jgi:hypothetical protein